MPRKARIIVPGAIHHIMSRGNEGKKIFLIDDGRNFFLNTVEQQLQKSGYLLYAWCLMDNHYHLLLRVEEETMYNPRRVKYLPLLRIVIMNFPYVK